MDEVAAAAAGVNEADLRNAFPRDQVPTITHSICPSNDIYNECYSLDFSGTNDDDVILLKELGPQGFATGRLQSQSDSEIVSLWNDNVGLNVTVCTLIIRLQILHFLLNCIYLTIWNFIKSF